VISASLYEIHPANSHEALISFISPRASRETERFASSDLRTAMTLSANLAPLLNPSSY